MGYSCNGADDLHRHPLVNGSGGQVTRQVNRFLSTIGRVSRELLIGKRGLLPLRFLRIQYQVTPTHFEILVDGTPERRVPLTQVLDAVEAERSFGRPFDFWRFFPPWRYERWGNDPTHATVLVRQRSGLQLIITPKDARGLIHQLNEARARLSPHDHSDTVMSGPKTDCSDTRPP